MAEIQETSSHFLNAGNFPPGDYQYRGFPLEIPLQGIPPPSGTAKDSPLETLLQGISPGDTTAGDFRKTAHLSQFTLSSVSTEITKGERS